MTKWVYAFGGGEADGRADMKDLLGGKGANLAEMSNLGLSVPPGFTITTEVCTYYYENKRSYPKELEAQVRSGVAFLEEVLGKKFGDMQKPLLVSVRSGARDSMGMIPRSIAEGPNRSRSVRSDAGACPCPDVPSRIEASTQRLRERSTPGLRIAVF